MLYISAVLYIDDYEYGDGGDGGDYGAGEEEGEEEDYAGCVSEVLDLGRGIGSCNDGEYVLYSAKPTYSRGIERFKLMQIFLHSRGTTTMFCFY